MKRSLSVWVAALALSTTAIAQETKIKFQLDWRFEGPAALFLQGNAKGHYKAEKLDVIVDSGNGSGNAVNRVASGTYGVPCQQS
jgi:NitT/TauT family transport system substrate-binding protein